MPSPYIHLIVVKSDKLPERAATEWGYGAVVQDPDGRKVELMQRNSGWQWSLVAKHIRGCLMKDFKIKAEQIVRLIGPVGAATATDMIMVEGRDIGYMYREDPINDVDTGWRFFAGDESDAYIEDNNNTGFYDINTIANYDPSIIARLDESVGTSWERVRGTNLFRQVER